MRDEDREEIGGKMSFLEHLDELRRRLIFIVAYIAIGFVVSWVFREEIYRFVSRPITVYLEQSGGTLVVTKLTEAFSVYLRVAILSGIFLTAPLIIHQVWLFISPGLFRRERRMAAPFIFFSVLLFVGGGAFAYFLVLPRAYPFLLEFGSDFTPMLKADDYWSLTSTILLGLGLVFEMPVVIAFLSLFGMITPRFLWKNFKYAILIIFIIAAIISPTPDVVNQCIFAAPMIVLYFVSIAVSFIFKRRRDRRELERWED